MGTTSSTTIARQATAALHAITQHAVDHCLPAPMSIDTDAEGIEVTVVSTDAPRWLATVHVDSRLTEPRSHGFVTRHTVRLPDTGVKFRIRYLHRDREQVVGTVAMAGGRS